MKRLQFTVACFSSPKGTHRVIESTRHSSNFGTRHRYDASRKSSVSAKSDAGGGEGGRWTKSAVHPPQASSRDFPNFSPVQSHYERFGAESYHSTSSLI